MAFADRSCCASQDVQELSRFSCMLFLSVRGFLDYPGPNQPLAFNVVVVLPSSSRNGVGILYQRLFEAQQPRPLIPLSTLQATPRDAACKTPGQDGFATLLSCRALSSPTTRRFIPTLSEYAVRTKPLARQTLRVRYSGHYGLPECRQSTFASFY